MSGGQEGQEYELVGPVVTIGRLASNDVCLSWDMRVSRHHARLLHQDGTWVLEDVNSTNGTFLEAIRLTARAPVPVGAHIRAGRIWLQLRTEAMPAPSPSRPLPAVEVPAEPREPMADEVELWEPAVAETVNAEPTAERDAALVEHETLSAVQSAPTPGFWQRLAAWFGFGPAVETTAAPEPAPATTKAPPEAVDGGTILGEQMDELPSGPLKLEIRAHTASDAAAADTDALKRLLAELGLPPNLGAQMQETLGSSDVRISLTAPAGSQGELLVFAGRVVECMTKLPDYRDVMVVPLGD